MSQEVFALIREMNMKDVATQMVLQCAPLITGIKVSNLLIISKANMKKVRQILNGTHLSYVILLEMDEKITLMLFHREQLEAYLSKPCVQKLLVQLGYQSFGLEEMLPEFQVRYANYMISNRNFPHEMGLLLGYPTEDVQGFIENEGKNFLYTGYWKVYANLSEKIRVFQSYEDAKEDLIHQVSHGMRIEDMIHTYYKKQLQVAY